MAGLTKAQRAERAAQSIASTEKQRPDDGAPGEQISGLTDAGETLEPCDGLTAMYKGSETLRVHPSCVQAHKSAGWFDAA